jgi:hypothetical protein
MNFYKKVKFSTYEQSKKDLAEALRDNKVVHAAEYNLDMPVEDFYTGFADSIGEPYNVDEDILSGKRKENRWIQISFDPEIQDRYRTAKTRQPLHTDDSYAELYDQKNVQFFFCKSKSALGGATTFFDLDQLVDCLKLDGEEELLNRLLSTNVNFEKQGSKKVRKIIDKDEVGYLANWNYYCIDKNNTEAALKLVEEFHEYLETRIITAGLVLPAVLEVGEAVFFHDDRLLHGRNSYFASVKGERCLVKGKIIFSEEYLAE